MQTKNKKNGSFSIEKTLLKEFDEYCRENSINKSNLIERYIKSFLSNVKEKEN